MCVYMCVCVSMYVLKEAWQEKYHIGLDLHSWIHYSLNISTATQPKFNIIFLTFFIFIYCYPQSDIMS